MMNKELSIESGLSGQWLLALAPLLLLGCGDAGTLETEQAALPERITFTEHVAPILFRNCASCHRPGEAGPFDLLTYNDAKRRAKQIAYVTQERIMPPWMPEPACEDYLGERRLSERQIALLAGWTEQGAIEGPAAELPALPEWTEGWQLGEPDLVLQFSEPYELSSTGLDVFHTYVIPIPVSSTHFVRAVELRPQNRRVVHHALMMVNTDEGLRRLDAAHPGPGFPGTETGNATWPEGHMPGWLPGRQAFRGRDDIAWRLEPGTDAVLQLHMVPSGKLESVDMKIGFFWADQAPTREATLLTLRRGDMDIPPGEKNYRVQDQFVLPVDLEIMSLQPHAHYLGTILRGTAWLPDGTQKSLVDIPRWDFNWQDMYHFAKPVFLPQGTTISIDYTFDNSAENERNPSSPPQRVVHGWGTLNEMAELWLQVVPKQPADMPELKQAFVEDVAQDRLEEYIGLASEALKLRIWDKDMQHELADAHNQLAQLWTRQGRLADAKTQYELALVVSPGMANTHNNLGLFLAEQGQWEAAVPHYEEALAAQPNLAKAHLNLGLALEQLGKPAKAERHLERALKLQPQRAEYHNELGAFRLRRGNLEEALGCFREALKLDPALEEARKHLEQVKARLKPGR